MSCLHKIVLVSVVFFWFVPGEEVLAQNSKLPGLKVHYGWILPHAPDLVPVGQTHPRGFELEWNWQLMSRNAWQYCYCYPRTGVSLMVMDFGNRDELGYAIAPYLFIEPVLGAERALNTSIRFGIGPSWMTRVYDSVNNPRNTFYSSHLSFLVLLSGKLNYRLNEHFTTHIFANFNHISNGGLKNPNRGINFATIGAGIDYNLNPLPFKNRIRADSTDLNPDKWRIDLVVFGTGKTDIKGDDHYPVLGIYSGVSRVVGRLSGIAAGIEMTIDKADEHEMKRLAASGESEVSDHKYIAALGGYDLLIGRFNFSILMGAYLYSPFERMDPVFQRYGLNFKLTDRFIAGINIKAHRHVADFMDVRLGVVF